MRLGITGANGFIGSHLLRFAVGEGLRPVAFLQEGTSTRSIADLEGKFDAIGGDLGDAQALESFMSQCDSIIHLAGLNRYWAPDPGLFWRVNRDIPARMAEACLRHGIRKLVHASSCITLGASAGPVARNEDSPYNLGELRFLYGESKKAGEDEIKRRASEDGLPAVIVNPTSAIGEADFGPTPIGKPIRDIARGMWPAYVAGGACFIDVHDVVRGFWAALERGRPGAQYLLAGENLTNREFMSFVAECAGARAPRVRVPKPFLELVGSMGEWVADHWTRRHPPLTRGMSGLVGRYLYFDGARARDELGFRAGSCRPAIERCVRWFREAQAA